MATLKHLVIYGDATILVVNQGEEIPFGDDLMLTLPLDDSEMPLIHFLQGQSTGHTVTAFAKLLAKAFNRGVTRGRASEMGSSPFGHPLPGSRES